MTKQEEKQILNPLLELYPNYEIYTSVLSLDENQITTYQDQCEKDVLLVKEKNHGIIRLAGVAGSGKSTFSIKRLVKNNIKKKENILFATNTNSLLSDIREKMHDEYSIWER